MEESNFSKLFTARDSPRLPLWAFGLLIVGVLGIGYGVFSLQNLSNADKTVIISPISSAEPIVTETVQQVRVDISGAVAKPGVYSLAEGSILQEAIAEAGGWEASADAAYIAQQLNLAEEVHDQQKIYIPFQSDKSSSNSSSSQNQVLGSSSQPGKIRINKASQEELESLSGIGEVRAGKIIENRPYSSLQELVEKKVLSQSLFDKLKDELSL